MARSRFRPPPRRLGPTFIQALERMRGGALLHLTFVRNLPVWQLDAFDIAVAPEVVALLFSCSEIEAVGNSLFDGMPLQTWRVRK